MILYLVRHGETDWNRQRRIQGHSDIPLNEQGILQARRLAERFRKHPADIIFSSDLLRARQTAEIIGEALDLPVHTCPRLRERSFGQLEGMTVEEIKQRYSVYPIGTPLEEKYGIESLERMQERIVARLEEIMAQYGGKQVLVVSHGAAINAFIHYATKGEMGTGKTSLDNTAISRFLYSGRTWSVEAVNDTRHLA